MIKWIGLALLFAFCWYEGYRYGYDEGFGDGRDAEWDRIQLLNMKAIIRARGKE